MISSIEQIILQSVDVFLGATAKEFDIPLSTLKENWRNHFNKPVDTKKPVKKSSLYQNFFVQKRSELIQSQPDIQFGELSSRISKMWKDMTKEQQQAYGDVGSGGGGSGDRKEEAIKAVETKPVVATEFNFEMLNNKTMPELRKLCEEKGLKRTGNKATLISHLMGEHTTVPVKEVVVKKPSVVVMAEDGETEDVEVVMAKNMKRADIEEDDVVVSFLEDEEDEEGNFEFEEGSNYSISLEDDD
jgi:HMG (high mobility group) box